MPVPLKRIDLLLDKDLIRRGFVKRIRKLRETMGQILPDGTEIIRESRDRGW
jgi:hypothetical protein